MKLHFNTINQIYKVVSYCKTIKRLAKNKYLIPIPMI